MEITVNELIENLKSVNGNAIVCIKTWSSEIKKEIEIVNNGDGKIIIKEA